MSYLKENLQLLKGLEPSALFYYFAQLSAINRSSGNERELCVYIYSLAKKQGYRYVHDEHNNLVIYVPATAGRENQAAICLQAHLDMVAIDSNGKEFDTSQIRFLLELGLLKADGRTLGADNGIGVAAIIAFLMGNGSSHGPLELLLTAQEEVGMYGVKYLDPKLISARLIINLDTEEWGEFTVGCAGGGQAIGQFALECGSDSYNGEKLCSLKLTGLRGGHSGMDIMKGHGNAISLIARVLTIIFARWPDSRLVSLNGGVKMNAIPNEAEAVFYLVGATEKIAAGYIASMERILQVEFSPIDGKLELQFSTNITPPPATWPLSVTFQDRLLLMLQILPNGPLKMDPNDLSVIESSNNLALVRTTEKEIQVTCMYRSASESYKDHLKNLIVLIYHQAGVRSISFESEYPAWPPQHDALDFLSFAGEKYKAISGSRAKRVTVHGGLEPGYFIQYWPDAQIISFGPTIRFPHSDDEHLEVSTVEHFWNLLVSIIEDFGEFEAKPKKEIA